MEIGDILNFLPHRYPFLLVDRILEIEHGKSITALKNVTINEPFFSGHFPVKPVMPGVLIIESMAQASGILAIKTTSSKVSENKNLFYFMSIEKAKFRKMVIPGDTLIHKAEIIQVRSNVWKLGCKTYVDNKIVAEAVLSAMVEENKNI